jgi:hypothetical protein
MRRWMLLLLAVLLVASQLWGPPAWRVFRSRVIACGHFVVEVRGRLVDGRDGQPLAHRAVCTLPRASSEQGPALADAFARAAASAREGPLGARRPLEEPWWPLSDLDALNISDAEGRFQVQARVWHSTTYIGGEPQGPEEASPEESVRGLLIEAGAAGRPIEIGPLPRGSFQMLHTDGGLNAVRATWDLGDVRVPAAR